MAERKKGPKEGDYEVMMERKLLEGMSWKEWKHSLENFLKEKGYEMPEGKSEEILHKIFIARRMNRIGLINSDEMLDKIHEATDRYDELIDNDPAVLLSMRYITNRSGLDKTGH